MTTVVVVPDFEFVAAKTKAAVSFPFPAQKAVLPSHSKDPLSRFQAKSKRAQLLLRFVEEFKGSQEKEQPAFDAILKTPKVIIVTVEALNRALEYLEASMAEWHLERGLQPEYKARTDVVVMTSKEKDPLGGISSSKGYRQEVYEFGKNVQGYVFCRITSIGRQTYTNFDWTRQMEYLRSKPTTNILNYCRKSKACMPKNVWNQINRNLFHR